MSIRQRMRLQTYNRRHKAGDFMSFGYSGDSNSKHGGAQRGHNGAYWPWMHHDALVHNMDQEPMAGSTQGMRKGMASVRFHGVVRKIKGDQWSRRPVSPVVTSTEETPQATRINYNQVRFLGSGQSSTSRSYSRHEHYLIKSMIRLLESGMEVMVFHGSRVEKGHRRFDLPGSNQQNYNEFPSDGNRGEVDGWVRKGQKSAGVLSTWDSNCVFGMNVTGLWCKAPMMSFFLGGSGYVFPPGNYFVGCTPDPVPTDVPGMGHGESSQGLVLVGVYSGQRFFTPSQRSKGSVSEPNSVVGLTEVKQRAQLRVLGALVHVAAAKTGM